MQLRSWSTRSCTPHLPFVLLLSRDVKRDNGRLLGIALWFVLFNNDPVKVSFPFLGEIGSTSGIVMLVSAALGAAGCWLVLTFRHAVREARSQRAESAEESAGAPASPEPHARTGTEPERTESEGPKSVGP